MADLRLGIAFQAERLALIQEIARNLVGESPPPGGTSPARPAGVPAQATLAGAEDALLAEHLVASGGTPQARPNPPAGMGASLLAGMKLPHAPFAQPDAHQQALAQFAKSEPALATMFAAPARPDALALAGTVEPPVEVASETQPADAGEADLPLTASTSTDTNPATLLPSTLRWEPVAGTRTVADAIPAIVLAAAETSAPDAIASTESVVERALLSLGLAESAANPAAMRGELGGIIASFVLNAHFQPGWPPLRPIQDPEAKALVAQLARDAKLSKDDIAMLTYLANFGLNRQQLSRILKLVASATNRSKLLESLAQLLANIGTLLGAVHAEIEALAEEVREGRAGGARRERLTLR